MHVRDPMRDLGIASHLRELRLTKAERATLARAAAILREVRERAEDGPDDDAMTDVALAAYTCADLADEGRVVL